MFTFFKHIVYFDIIKTSFTFVLGTYIGSSLYENTFIVYLMCNREYFCPYSILNNIVVDDS